MHRKPGYFYCFSPAVMVVTFIVELFFVIFAVIQYGVRKPKNIISVVLLFLLAMFQLAEYLVCMSVGNPVLLSRMGFILITLLPPLGIHLSHAIINKKTPLLLLPYSASISLITFFLLSENTFSTIACTGNYVIFNITPLMDILYGFYYHGFLIVGLYFAVKYSHLAESIEQRKILSWLAVGYAFFMFPTGAVILMKPETIRGIPSVMCGFALFLAFILFFIIIPAGRKKGREGS